MSFIIIEVKAYPDYKENKEVTHCTLNVDKINTISIRDNGDVVIYLNKVSRTFYFSDYEYGLCFYNGLLRVLSSKNHHFEIGDDKIEWLN